MRTYTQGLYMPQYVRISLTGDDHPVISLVIEKGEPEQPGRY